MQNNYNQQSATPKSATTAGLLGIFLGEVGAHSFYLGEKQKGFIHLGLFGAGAVLQIVNYLLMTSSYGFGALRYAGIIALLNVVSSAIIGGNGIWGLVEGINLLMQGDAGLAAKGYVVATPINNAPMNNQPMNNQPMNNMPMNNQPVNNAPMNNQSAQNQPQSNDVNFQNQNPQQG